MKLLKKYQFYFLMGIMFFNLVDGLMTVYWVYSGLAIEANPLMALLLDYSAGSFMLVKTILVLGGITILIMFRSRKIAIIGSFLLFLVYSTVMVIHITAIL